MIFPECDVLCFSKLPQKAHLNQLLAWLEEREERKAVVFDSASQPNHSKLVMCDRDRPALERLAKECVFLNFDYVEQDAGDAALFAEVEEVVERVTLSFSDYTERGVDRLQNLLKNSCHFKDAYPAFKLFGSFSQIPAIICGAGPSLDSQAPYLRLLRERALFFAGGATLTRLCELEIRPHFAGLIDPHPPRKIDRKHTAFETPCFFQSRCHPEKLNSFQGPFLWTPGFGQDFFEEDFFEGGWNVSTYLTAIACHLGCNPIVLVGVDLCGDRDRLYSGRIESSANLIELPSGAKAKRDWIFAARFLSDFANQHPEVEWINTSNWIEFGGIENRRLDEVVFESQYDLSAMIHASISTLKPKVLPDFEKDKVLESLSRVSSLCGQLIEQLKKHFPHLPDGDGEYAILEIELEREEAYIQFAKPVWMVWKPVFARKIAQGLLGEALGLKFNQWLFIKGICDDARQIRN